MSIVANKILLATDGSVEAARAAQMAVTLTEKLGSELHVIQVAPMPESYSWTDATIVNPDLLEELRDHAQANIREKLDKELEKIRDMGGEVAASHIVTGRPDAEIVGTAEDIGADLVVLGSRGVGRLRRALMGSISTSVVRHARGSVLVVRDVGSAVDRFPGRILLALDGSKEAFAAARFAAEISNTTGSELHVLYVLPTDEAPPYGPILLIEEWESSLQQAKQEARRFVDEQARRIEDECAKVKDAHLVFGRPDKEIVKLGEELEAGLIVLGSRGLHGVRRALMGSVSDSVVRHARGPVLVVREEHVQEPVAQRSAEESLSR